jgi:hypothetical protein
MTTDVVFVGNGKMTTDYSDLVDSSDIIIRSQTCKNYGGLAGSGTDILCVRPSNEPFGKEVARDKKIPQGVANECTALFMAHRYPRQNLELLYKHYPRLRHLPLMCVNEESTRQLLLQHGATTKRTDNQVNPTMGMCLLHHFIEWRRPLQLSLTCVGFAWDYGYDDHDDNTERTIQQDWANAGLMEFMQ